eukprot:15451611-Alexandrium_andersonii.AAC.1
MCETNACSSVRVDEREGMRNMSGVIRGRAGVHEHVLAIALAQHGGTGVYRCMTWRTTSAKGVAQDRAKNNQPRTRCEDRRQD